jgi:hypothetical protein
VHLELNYRLLTYLGIKFRIGTVSIAVLANSTQEEEGATIGDKV